MTKTYNDVEAVTRLLEEVKTYRVSMTRKCHNHTLQTDQRHREEEDKNNNSHMTSRRQLKLEKAHMARFFLPILGT